MFTTSLISFVTLSSLFLPSALAAPGPAWIRRQEDAQSSLTLDPAVISHGLEQDGQGDTPDPGQVRSLTSSNNFINFCLGPLAQGVPLTNGKQITTGSCNQTPMGRIISLDKAPRSKFVFPKNGDESIVENTAFVVQMKIINMETGNFVNAQANYYAAPQQVNGDGVLVGHSHVVIEKLPSLQSTEPLDPTTFAFFKGLNDVAQDDILTANVTSGLAAGVYRICSINTASNHQPALVSNAQHGSLDDCSYFTVKSANDSASSTSTSSNATATSTADSTSTNTTTSATATATETGDASASDAAATTQSTSTTGAADAASTDSSSADQATSTESSSSADPTSTDSAADSTSTDSAADSTSTDPAADSTSTDSAADSTSTDSAADPSSTETATDSGSSSESSPTSSSSSETSSSAEPTSSDSSDAEASPSSSGDDSSAPTPTSN